MSPDLAFERLSRALAARGIDPAERRLDRALPRRGRAELWEELEADLDLRLPGLSVPAWLSALGAASALAVGLALGPGAGLLCAALAWSAARPFAVALPSGCGDRRGLAWRVALGNFRRR